ncbi:MAG: hypothetical protein DHS80DRAFT_31820 [Piptocephalis tieghemiana]|nr:MAG: hypothetical protein DHS80DRAFT_31820 [Piptocephalis tieghemiana]
MHILALALTLASASSALASPMPMLPLTPVRMPYEHTPPPQHPMSDLFVSRKTEDLDEQIGKNGQTVYHCVINMYNKMAKGKAPSELHKDTRQRLIIEAKPHREKLISWKEAALSFQKQLKIGNEATPKLIYGDRDAIHSDNPSYHDLNNAIKKVWRSTLEASKASEVLDFLYFISDHGHFNHRGDPSFDTYALNYFPLREESAMNPEIFMSFLSKLESPMMLSPRQRIMVILPRLYYILRLARMADHLHEICESQSLKGPVSKSDREDGRSLNILKKADVLSLGNQMPPGSFARVEDIIHTLDSRSFICSSNKGESVQELRRHVNQQLQLLMKERKKTIENVLKSLSLTIEKLDFLTGSRKN